MSQRPLGTSDKRKDLAAMFVIIQLRATFKALYTIIFYDHRKNVEQLLREYDSVMPP